MTAAAAKGPEQAGVTVDELWIDSEAGRLHARRWVPAGASARSAIVLFHDSLGSVALWRDFPEQMARTTARTVIAYDRLGFGRSDPYPGVLPPSFIGDEATTGFRAVREHLGLDRYIALGHSVGGCMAVGVAAHDPQRCVALITESAQSFVEDRTRAGIVEAQRAFAADGQIERLAKYHGDKARWVLGAWIDTWLSPAFAQWTLDAQLRRVQCPVLALHGDQDQYGSVVHPRRIAELVQGPSTARIFEGCGHVPHREIGAEVLAVLVDWLDRLP
jgi:pimeloyl-ACP methyl ester carboxylesterase